MFAQKLKARCAVLLRQDEREDRRNRERLPCNLKIDLQTAGGLISVPVYEIAMEGIPICGPDAERLPLNEPLKATLESIGACRIRIHKRSKAGALARFEAKDAALSEKIEDRLWSIHDENTEFVTRAMEAGAALTKIFEGAIASGAISIDDMFDTDYVEIAGTNPVQHRARILGWADRALPPFQEAFLAKDPRMAFCATIYRKVGPMSLEQDSSATSIRFPGPSLAATRPRC
jgi:methyl-accepting chemotaxis protein